MKYLSPQEIEAESMRIIEQEAGSHCFATHEWAIVKRIIHATADFDVMKAIRFHPDAVFSAVRAIQEGHPVYTDTEMLSAAINKKITSQWLCEIVCLIGDAGVKKEAEAAGEPRSVVAIRKAAPSIRNGIIAIGNAPTALFETMHLHSDGSISPGAVIGMPTGFVGAAEAKDKLLQSKLPYITMVGRKGGTPAAAAALNALIQLAEVL